MELRIACAPRPSPLAGPQSSPGNQASLLGDQDLRLGCKAHSSSVGPGIHTLGDRVTRLETPVIVTNSW